MTARQGVRPKRLTEVRLVWRHEGRSERDALRNGFRKFWTLLKRDVVN